MELPVRVTLLGEKPVSFLSAIVTLEPRQLSFRSTAPLSLRVPLKIESANQLWMGEVIDSHKDAHQQSWVAVVRIQHALLDVADLTHLADRFVGKPERAGENSVPRELPAAWRAIP